MSLAAAEEINMDAAVTAVLLELDDIFTLKQKTELNTFPSGKDVFILLLNGFGKSSVKHHGASWVVTGH